MREPNRAGADGRRRRDLLRGGLFAVLGAGVGAAGYAGVTEAVNRRLPVRGAAAKAVLASRPELTDADGLMLTWRVQTDRRLVALTFDDGPAPRWTPMVLDILDQRQVPATFFMVGERARRHAALVRDRMAGHEVGSHTWAHHDLARLGPEEAYADLVRTHQQLAETTGQEPRLLRPPYGNLGGGATAAAARMRYHVVLWSLRMRELEFRSDPAGHVRYIVANTQPGTILLAHDVGKPERLIALRSLPEMIDKLRERGFRFVTVSELLRLLR